MLDYGQVGKEYKVQLQADSGCEVESGFRQPASPGSDFASDRSALRSSSKDGYFHFTVQADNNTGRATCDLDLTIIEAERPEEKYRLTQRILRSTWESMQRDSR